MTILGCDDSGAECHYVATVEKRWPTIELCDSVAEDELYRYANSPYPTIIAVCQKPEDNEVATAQQQQQPAAPVEQKPADEKPVEVTQQQKETLAGSAIKRVKSVLPTTEGVRTMMQKPVRLVEDSYSWVARKFSR
jgi:hypothetical protein